MLTTLPDEVLVNVFSCLSFKDRQVTRQACRRLKNFVDISAPGAETLRICVHSTNDRDVVRMQLDGYRDMDVNVDIDLSPQVRLAALLLRSQHPRLSRQSRVPSLNFIRPKRLDLLIGDIMERPEAFAMLMRHLMLQQVGRSVTSISLRQEGPLGRLANVQQVCARFNRLSDSGVQHLELSGCPQMLLPVATSFPRLAALTLEFGLNNVERTETFAQELTALSGHPTLSQLRIQCAPTLIGRWETTTIEFGLMTSLASTRNLQKLDYDVHCRYRSFNDEQKEEFTIAFGNLLRGMRGLQSLGTLPGTEFWRQLCDRNYISFDGLSELKFQSHFIDETREKLDEMVEGLLSGAPSLTTLQFGFQGGMSYEEELIIRALLTKLREHPTLQKLELPGSWPLNMRMDYYEKLVPLLQQRLGTKIELVV